MIASRPASLPKTALYPFMAFHRRSVWGPRRLEYLRSFAKADLGATGARAFGRRDWRRLLPFLRTAPRAPVTRPFDPLRGRRSDGWNPGLLVALLGPVCKS